MASFLVGARRSSSVFYHLGVDVERNWRLCCPRVYFCGNSTDKETQLETFEGPVPRDKLQVSFSRSSGPGGQNVNKLNTKADVRFHVDSADWLPQRVKTRLRDMFKSRLNKEGEMFVVCQEHRTQHRNLEGAVRRLETILHEASEVPQGPSQLTMARIRALKKKAQRQKMIEKKYHSKKKQARRTDNL